MKIFKCLLITLFISLINKANSQTIDDILRVSMQNYEGTSRFAAMGGAFGALGGDVSALSVNPGGIGVFRKAMVSFTGSLNHNYNNSALTGINSIDSRTRPGISNMGYIYSDFEEDKRLNWVFGISYTKRANFNRRTFARSAYSENSIIDYISNKANSDISFFNRSDLESVYAFEDYDPLDWDVVLGHGTYLIYWDDTDEKYYGDLYQNDKLKQQINVLHKGSSNELLISGGFNLDDKFYVGASLGLNFMAYGKNVSYYEDAHEDNISEFKRLAYNTNLKIEGAGMNLKIGTIYRPLPFIRFGFAFHSPDYFISSYSNSEENNNTMFNNYNASMETEFVTSSGSEIYSDEPGEEFPLFFNRLRTPLKTVGSLAFMFGRFGLISADCEFINYSGIRISGSEPKSAYNSDMSEHFKNTFNFRLGTEIWIKNIALRGGYNYYPSPDKLYNLSRKSYSAGIGYRIRDLQFDIAYVQSNSKDFYTPYTGANTITENLKNRRISLTVGWRFNPD